MQYRLPSRGKPLPYDVVDLLSDEESDTESRPESRAGSTYRALDSLDESLDQETIDLTGDDEDGYVREVTPHTLKTIQARKKTVGNVLPGYRLIPQATTSFGWRLNASPEAPAGAELRDGDFLRVDYIYKHLFTQEVVVNGLLLKRIRRVHNYFPKRRNELCIFIQQTEDAEDLDLNSSLVTRSLDEIVQMREIIFTNAEFPSFSFRHDRTFDPFASPQSIEDTAVLVCRWKFTEYCNPANGKVMKEVLKNLPESEADKGRGVSDLTKKRRWRNGGEKDEDVVVVDTPGASSARVKNERSSSVFAAPSSKRKEAVVDLTNDDEPEEVTTKIRKTSTTETFSSKDGSSLVKHERKSITSYTISKPGSRASSVSGTGTFGRASVRKGLTPYTYGEHCAGGGGTARAAFDFGFDVKFLLDHWSVACDTLRLDFPRAKVLQMDINTFCVITAFEGYMRVDILHISYPCQTHSKAHTREGKNDEANEATAFSIEPLLKKSRPRVVTFEQTWNILSKKSRPHFAALIHSLTSQGYNVRWKVIGCLSLGNCQPRKRLFLIASCPGEPLPPFPEPTHGPGLKPFVTIRDRLALLPATILPHMQQYTQKDGPSYNDNCILKQAITCNGGEGDLHPSGKRSFNMQELALLAGFPPYHRFTGNKTDIRKQIGNAVPGMVARALFSEVEKTMRQTDRDEARKEAQLRREAIVLE